MRGERGVYLVRKKRDKDWESNSRLHQQNAMRLQSIRTAPARFSTRAKEPAPGNYIPLVHAAATQHHVATTKKKATRLRCRLPGNLVKPIRQREGGGGGDGPGPKAAVVIARRKFIGLKPRGATSWITWLEVKGEPWSPTMV